MLGDRRNQEPLTDRQIEQCLLGWAEVCHDGSIGFDISEATQRGGRTRFVEVINKVVIGPNAFPGEALDANSRMSMLACLAHEFAHAERYNAGFRWPTDLPDVLIDEASASLTATFILALSPKDREDLVEDARDRLIQWLKMQRDKGGGT